MLYAVFVKANPGTDITRIQEVIEPADSWYRISPSVWIISSDEDTDVWTERLLRLVKPNGYVFIAKLDPFDRQGYMPQKFWDWFDEQTELH